MIGYCAKSSFSRVTSLFIYLNLIYIVFITGSKADKDHARNIYIDLGSNDGQSIKSFLQPLNISLDPSLAHDGSNYNGGKLRENFDGITNWEIFAVEANPKHTPDLESMKTWMVKEKMVKSFTLYNSTAVSTKNGFLTFILDTPDGGDAGATLMKDSFSAQHSSFKVKSIDIITLLRKFKPKDNVIVKMDIEGAEYDVVRRILITGSMKLIDKLAVEWHHEANFVFGERTDEPITSLRNVIHQKYHDQYNSIQWLIEGSETIKKKFSSWG